MSRYFYLITFLSLFSIPTFADSIGQTQNLKGELLVNGKKFSKNTPIQEGDTLELKGKDNSSVDLHFKGGHRIRLKGPSQLKVNAFSKTIDFSLNYGQIFTSVEKSRRQIEFKVKTPTAVAGVRGTKFFLKENQDGAYLCVCEGHVALKSVDEIDKHYLVAAGQDMKFKSNLDVEKPHDSPQMVQMVTKEFKSMGLSIR